MRGVKMGANSKGHASVEHHFDRRVFGGQVLQFGL